MQCAQTWRRDEECANPRVLRGGLLPLIPKNPNWLSVGQVGSLVLGACLGRGSHGKVYKGAPARPTLDLER